jgi:aryl sulfotransferase
LPVDFAAEGVLFPQAASRDAFDRILGIESSDLTPDEDEVLRPRVYEALARQAGEPMIRRVHGAFVRTGAGEPLFAPELTLGVIYLARDARDVAVSYAHYMDWDIDSTIHAMGNPAASAGVRPGALSPLLRQRLLTWSGHVESWLDAGVPLLLIRYEDMLKDAAAILTAVTSFLNWDTKPETIAAAVEATRFDRLQSQEQQHGFDSRTSRSGSFFRRGIAGGWREALTAEQAGRIERDHGRVLTRLGYPLTAHAAVPQ